MNQHDKHNQMSYLPKSYGTRREEAGQTGPGSSPTESDHHTAETEAAKEFTPAAVVAPPTEAAADSPPVDEDEQALDREDEYQEIGMLEEVAGAAAPAIGDSDQPKVAVTIVGVRFSPAGKIYSFDANDMKLGVGDWVVMKTEKGVGLGQVAVAPYAKEVTAQELDGLRKVTRKAGKVDMEQRLRCEKREAQARRYCLERIAALGLPMKLVAVECFFDGSKYVFYFTSEGRVDFRELVKQLVVRFPVRIEMRQIGVRHEAKMIGGLACCGQELCCARYLTDFKPVSVRMAKAQNLSLNPTKISGVCGRLMCCLAYEHDTYESFKKGLPKVGKSVCTRRGEGVVVKLNPLSETLQIKLDEETLVEVGKDEIMASAEPPAKKKKSSRKGEKPAEQHAEQEPAVGRDAE